MGRLAFGMLTRVSPPAVRSFRVGDMDENALAALDEAQMPAMPDYERWLGPVQITPVLVPHDCSDGFLYAYWRRPAAYLDPTIRSGSSSFLGHRQRRSGFGETAARS
jgi:hypothetical protein